MSNADLLWDALVRVWPENTQWLTIHQVVELVPLRTAGITNLSSYDFAMLTMLSTERRKEYVIHQNAITQQAINDEVVKVNRNNGIWRQYIDSKVCKRHIKNNRGAWESSTRSKLFNDFLDEERIEEDDVPAISEAISETQSLPSLSRLAYEILEELVASIQDNESWDTRLKNYSWRGCNFFQTEEALFELVWTGSVLSRLIIAEQIWSPQDEIKAQHWAEEIFRWGGTYQKREITAHGIRATLTNAIKNRIVVPNAPMNSGYTKVASFGSSFLDQSPENHSQVINDTRVAASLTSRLDTILSRRNEDPRTVFPGLGRIDVARGGTRPRTLQLNWPDAYRSWQGQFAATQVVLCIRNILNNTNNHYPRMPNNIDLPADWTLRGIEAVLFMDGY